MAKSRILFISLLGGVVLVLVSVTLFYFTKKENPMTQNAQQQFQKLKESADQFRREGDFAQSVPAYEEIVKQPLSKEQEVITKTYLAFDLYRRNGPGDQAESMKVYLSIINDYTLPPLRRALAIGDIATLGIRDEVFVRDHLNQEPFLSFLPKLGQPFDTLLFSQKIFEYSDEIYPNSDAKLNIVSSLVTRIAGGNISGTEAIKNTELRIAQLLQEAEPLMTDVRYEPGNLAEQYLNRAIGLQSNGRYLGTPSFEEREKAYTEALAYASQDKNDVRILGILGQTRIFYAGFLLRFAPTDRSSDIKAQLSEFVAGKESRTLYVKNYILSRKGTGYMGKVIDDLASLSPDFKKYLKEIGF